MGSHFFLDNLSLLCYNASLSQVVDYQALASRAARPPKCLTISNLGSQDFFVELVVWLDSVNFYDLGASPNPTWNAVI